MLERNTVQHKAQVDVVENDCHDRYAAQQVDPVKSVTHSRGVSFDSGPLGPEGRSLAREEPVTQTNLGWLLFESPRP